jgi:transcriptional regulator with XRE-family HTH domain
MRRMSQEALADLVSLTRTSITNIEKGRQKLLVHKLLEIAGALGIDVVSLLPESNPSKTEGKIPNNLLHGLSEKDKTLITAAVTPSDKET